MKQNDIQFWVSDVSGDSGIRFLFESVYPNTFKKIEYDTISHSNINILVFKWESKFAIKPSFQTHTNEFLELVKKLNNLNFYFLADHSTEAESVINELEKIDFLNKLKSVGIPSSKILMAQNNSFDFESMITKIGNFQLKTFYFPHFLIATPYYMNQYVGEVHNHFQMPKSKDFLCLNRRVSTHKYNLLKRLWERGLLENTMWSWVATMFDDKLINEEFKNKNGLNRSNSIQLEGDVMYGSDLQFADEYLYTINPMWYYSSKVDIVNETHLNKKDVIHHTEKTFKPMYLGMPFITNATKNHLHCLGKLGFKTFESIIDESYNSTSNIDSLIDSALMLLEKWDVGEVKDICEFNKEKISNFDTYRTILLNFFVKPLEGYCKSKFSLI